MVPQAVFPLPPVCCALPDSLRSCPCSCSCARRNSLWLPTSFAQARCAELVEEAQARKTYSEPYPLADKKLNKRFKQGLVRLVDALLEKVKHEIVFDQVMLPWFAEWMTIMAYSSHRGMRHTGTEVGMAMMVKLTSLQVGGFPPKRVLPCFFLWRPSSSSGSVTMCHVHPHVCVCAARRSKFSLQRR